MPRLNQKARPLRAALLYQPAQYQEGQVTFCGRTFACDARALIPRFETELLVKEVVRFCKMHDASRPWRIADVGTGSGAIGVSIAAELPQAQVFASDISADALALARQNAAGQNVSDRTYFVQGNLLEPIIEPLDIIVANLPYLPTARIGKLDPSVRDFEPNVALDGGSDGFELYRELFDQIEKLSQKPRLSMFEIDADQGELALDEAARRIPNAACKVLRDSSGFVRYIIMSLK